MNSNLSASGIGKAHRNGARLFILCTATFLWLIAPIANGQTLPATSVPTIAPPGIPLSNELAGRTVEEVRITGNTTVSTAVIRNLVRSREGEKFDPATVEEDYQRIYGLKKFANVQARVEPTATGVIVILAVTEQKQISAIKFLGNAQIPDDVLKGALDIKVGVAIDEFRISISKQSLEKIYRDKGYPFAHISVDNGPLFSKGEVIFKIVEGPHVRVRKVAFKGNNSFTSDKLKDQIKTRRWLWIFRPGTFDTDLIDDDVAALRQYYEQHGFFDVRVGRNVAFSADQSEVMVTFVIDEGKRYVVDHISFAFPGAHQSLPENKLRAVLNMSKGHVYDVELLRRDIKAIVRLYSPLGFIYVPGSDDRDYLRIEPRTIFRKEAGTVDVVYEISEGRPFHIGRILVKGNSKVQDKVYLRELRVASGQLYNSGQLQDAMDRIRALRLASNVTITPISPGADQSTSDVRDILVQVDEGQTAFFMVGAGITSNAGVLGQISYEQRNFDITNIPSSWNELFSTRAFTGAGQYFRILLEPGTQQSRARVTFSEPYVFDQPYSFSSDIYYQTYAREAWEETRTGGQIGFGKRFTNEIVGRVSFRGEDVLIGGLTDEQRRALQIIELEGHTTITSISLDLRRDTTDNPLLPSKGSSIGAQWERVGAMGGQATFDKFTADAALHQTLNIDLLDRKTTLTEKIAAGVIDAQAPFFERFYGGGIGSLRGFRYRGVGPREGPDDDPVGGNCSVTGTVELNFPIVGDNLRGVVFSDAGEVENGFRADRIRLSAGAGFRLVLPIFGQVPVGLDFAVPLLQYRHDNQQLISFSLGFAQ